MGEFWSSLQEQITRVWENLSMQQRIIFVGAPTIVLVLLIVTLMMAAGPSTENLISSNDPKYLGQVADYLEQNNIEYETPDDRTIAVAGDVKAKALFGLAQEDLIGGYEGPGYELFDTMRLGMTDQLFELHHRQALENELEKTIRAGTKYDRVFVRLSIPPPSYFKEDEVPPSAAVKIESRSAPSQDQVVGIQNIVAFAVPGLDPENVVVTDRNNKQLAGMSADADSGAGLASKHDDVKKKKEFEIYSEIQSTLDPFVGPDDYRIIVEIELDWDTESVVSNQVFPDSITVLSEKTYEETSKSAAIAGEPGVDSNAQDTGIGPESGGELGTTINETITNNTVSKSETRTEKATGEIVSRHITVVVDYEYDDEADAYVAPSQETLQTIEDLIVEGFGLQTIAVGGGISRDSCKVLTAEFDRSLEEQLTRQERLAKVQKILLQYILPVVVLFVVFWLLYKYLQKAFAPKPIEEEPIEEVPIEPVTESRELTLAQLGLAEFGDIASLPAEEQRRLKMQEHVVQYAQEKPEEVAAIIKAWLTS